MIIIPYGVIYGLKNYFIIMKDIFIIEFEGLTSNSITLKSLWKQIEINAIIGIWIDYTLPQTYKIM